MEKLWTTAKVLAWSALGFLVLWLILKRFVETVQCPHCREPVNKDASVCPHCARDIAR